MLIGEIPLIIELLTLFSAGEVWKSLRNSGIPGVYGGNTTYYRAIDLFSAGEVRKSLWSSGIPGVDGGNSAGYRAIDPLFLQVKYESLSGVVEFRMWIAEIPQIIELLILFFCR